MKQTKVMILRGLPGSGKDAFLKSLAKADDLKIVTCSADHYFMQSGEYNFDPEGLTAAHEWCFRRFVQLCQSTFYEDNDLDVIAVSNTNSCLFEISPYLMYARYENTPIEIVEISVPDAQPKDYAERNVHGVPMAAIEGMMSQWERLPSFWSPETCVESRTSGFTVIGDVDRTIPFQRG